MALLHTTLYLLILLTRNVSLVAGVSRYRVGITLNPIFSMCVVVAIKMRLFFIEYTTFVASYAVFFVNFCLTMMIEDKLIFVIFLVNRFYVLLLYGWSKH